MLLEAGSTGAHDNKAFDCLLTNMGGSQTKKKFRLDAQTCRLVRQNLLFLLEEGHSFLEHVLKERIVVQDIDVRFSKVQVDKQTSPKNSNF